MGIPNPLPSELRLEETAAQGPHSASGEDQAGGPQGEVPDLSLGGQSAGAETSQPGRASRGAHWR